uniref:Uncharacterized protein n=1 Tax=Bosea sp. NBC_00436 TaxID=2969620 RepID=A0A9E7ZNG4_9HYPH
MAQVKAGILSKTAVSDSVDRANENVGTVDDPIATSTDNPPFAVLSVGSFLGMGSKCIDLEFLVSHGAIMSLSCDRARLVSNYDECTVLLLSAFFCVTGQTSKDADLRKAMEALLVDLIKAQNIPAYTNIVPFPRQWHPFPRPD